MSQMRCDRRLRPDPLHEGLNAMENSEYGVSVMITDVEESWLVLVAMENFELVFDVLTSATQFLVHALFQCCGSGFVVAALEAHWQRGSNVYT